jgi:biotin operon repressor
VSGILGAWPTSSRTLRLLSLLQSRRYWPGMVLAERRGVSSRTLHRDVDRLGELSSPVSAGRGEDGGYQLAPGASPPPLVLDDEEAVALAVGLQAAAHTSVAGMAEASVRALTLVVPVVTTDDLSWPVMALGSRGADFVVHSPRELLDHLRRWAALFARAHRGGRRASCGGGRRRSGRLPAAELSPARPGPSRHGPPVRRARRFLDVTRGTPYCPHSPIQTVRTGCLLMRLSSRRHPLPAPVATPVPARATRLRTQDSGLRTIEETA